MKVLTTSIASAIAACALVSTASAIAPAGPTVEYDSYDNPDTTANPTSSVTNTGSTAVAGTYYAPTTVSIVTGPSVGPNNDQAFHFNDGNGGNANLSTGINSNQTLGNVTGADTSFTMSAWVNLDAGAEANNADNMVFGTNGGAPMHLGFRGGQAYFGFWNNDSNQATTVDPTGTFQYFSWVYDGTANTQSIYENGALLGTATGKGHPGQVGENLTVGTNGGNGGDLAGAISDPTVYNTAFSAAQESALYSAQFNAVPEPSTWIAAGGLLLLAAGDSRRRLKA